MGCPESICYFVCIETCILRKKVSHVGNMLKHVSNVETCWKMFQTVISSLFTTIQCQCTKQVESYDGLLETVQNRDPGQNSLKHTRLCFSMFQTYLCSHSHILQFLQIQEKNPDSQLLPGQNFESKPERNPYYQQYQQYYYQLQLGTLVPSTQAQWSVFSTTTTCSNWIPGYPVDLLVILILLIPILLAN